MSNTSKPAPLAHALKLQVDEGDTHLVATFTDPKEIPRLLREVADAWELLDLEGL